MEFLEIEVSKDNSFTNSSKKILLKPDRMYHISTQIQKFQGDSYCGYFGVILFNQSNKEISRKIKWLNTISEKPIAVKLAFIVPKNVEYAHFIYRVNEEVPFKSQSKFKVLDPDLVDYRIVDSLEEEYDIPEDFQIPLKQELTKEEEDKIEKNLVWIFGAPRSGTSWLGTQLLSYETISVNEPLIGMHLGFIFFRNMNQLRTVDLFTREEDYFFSNKYRKTWNYHIRKLILNRIHAQCNNLEKTIVIKEPNGALGSDIISECLPKSKLIFLVRDGRDVLDSTINSLKENSWAVKNYNVYPWSLEKNKGITELESIAKIWVRTMSVLMKAYSNHDSNLRIKLKYEELLIGTYNELNRLYNFLGIKIPSEELRSIIDKNNFEVIPKDRKGSGKVSRSASPGKWKESFSDEEKNILNKIMGDQLKNLGYLD